MTTFLLRKYVIRLIVEKGNGKKLIGQLPDLYVTNVSLTEFLF